MNRRDFVRSAAAALSPQLLRARSRQSKPNVIFILADDLGYTGVRCFGGNHARTPNLDRLASQGVRFTNAYVTPQCTPTRASLLTGQHTARNRMWHVIPGYNYPYMRVAEPEFRVNLPRGAITLPSALRSAGYTTGIIGKWHLTANQDGHYEQLYPEAASHYGFDYAEARHDPPGVHQRTDKGVDRYTDEALGFIEKNRERPFFLYLAQHTVHGPVMAPPEKVQAYRRRGYLPEGQHNAVYLAAIEHLDASVGRIMSRLDEWKLAEDTMVVFLSDNGGIDPQLDNAPLRAGKGSCYEGGIRVPAIVRWNGGFKGGRVDPTPIHVCDWFPTLLSAAGAPAPAGHTLDGADLMPLFTAAKAPDRDALFWHMPLYDPLWGAVPAAIIRQDNYKLIDFFGDYIDIDDHYEYIPEGRVELFDLANDIGETRNLAASHPQLAAAMHKRLHAWIRSTGAEIPGLNPNFDITRALDRRDKPKQ